MFPPPANRTYSTQVTVILAILVNFSIFKVSTGNDFADLMAMNNNPTHLYHNEIAKLLKQLIMVLLYQDLLIISMTAYLYMKAGLMRLHLM